MIILDTNVISEPTKKVPSPKVLEWLDRQDPTSLYVTTVSVAEVWAGVDVLPSGQKRDALSRTMEELLKKFSANTVLVLDEAAARAYGRVCERAKANRYTLSAGDGFIAAIALAHGAIVATRDVDPFTAVDIAVINPWEE